MLYTITRIYKYANGKLQLNPKYQRLTHMYKSMVSHYTNVF